MEVKAYVKGYNLMDFFASKIEVEHGQAEEIGNNYVIAKGTFNTNDQYGVNYSSGWLDFRLTKPFRMKGTYTLSFDITLLETAENKETITFAVHRPSKFGRYTLPNVAGVKQHLVRTIVYSDPVEISIVTFSLNGLRVKIENIMFVEGNEEKPYDNGRIQVKPVIPVRNPKNLADLSALEKNGWIEFMDTDKRYFKWAYLNPSAVPEAIKYIAKFDTPQNVYARWVYKLYNETRPSNERGLVFVAQKSDGSKVELSSYLNRSGTDSRYIKDVIRCYISFGSLPNNTVGELVVSLVENEPYLVPQKCNIFIKE